MDVLASIMNSQSVSCKVGYLFSSPSLRRLNYVKIIGLVLPKTILLIRYDMIHRMFHNVLRDYKNLL
jgi:hypothetical protein